MRLQQSHPDLLIRARLANTFGALLPRFGQTAPADDGDLDPGEMACSDARQADKPVGPAYVTLTKSEVEMTLTSAKFHEDGSGSGPIRLPRCAGDQSQPQPFASLRPAFCGRGHREVAVRAPEQILSRS